MFLDADAFAKAPAKSIDYAVMERTDKCWVVPARFRWSDLGTWDALLDVGNADSAGNVTEGPVEIDHVRNSYVRSDGPLTAVIGVEEVVVVAMNDAVLVGHRDNLPRLKDVVQRMSEGKHRAATEHAVMHRPWGSYQDIDRGERFRAKRLTVNPKGKLSLQSHNRRAEHWVVVKGTAEVTLDGKIMTLHENEFDLHPDRRHPSPRQSRQRAARGRRGADRRLSRGRRHHPLRRYLRPRLMPFGVHHEWGKLREVVIGISPAEDFVVFHEESQRWLPPADAEFCRRHAGRRLIDVDPERARRIERQVDALAELVAREGVTVHRPERLQGEERELHGAQRRGRAALSRATA